MFYYFKLLGFKIVTEWKYCSQGYHNVKNVMNKYKKTAPFCLCLGFLKYVITISYCAANYVIRECY